MKVKGLLNVIDKEASIRVLLFDGKEVRIYCGINSISTMTDSQKTKIDEIIEKEVYNIVANKEDDFWIYVR